MDSITDYPEEWLNGAGGSFEAIFSLLALRLEWTPTGSEMLEMSRRLEPSYQPEFNRCIAGRI